jgi:hypothetical protein
MKSKRSLVLVAGVLALVTLFAASANASAPRVTQGDAQAILESSGGGGWAVRVHGGSIEGAPADFLPDSIARIGPNPPWEGRHFCSVDWHVISLNYFDGNIEGEARTAREIRAFLAETDLIFTLDGALLDTTRTPIKRFLGTEFADLVEAYWFAEGRVMAPADLSVGQHSLQADVLFPTGEYGIGPPITFFIDAPGEGTCL